MEAAGWQTLRWPVALTVVVLLSASVPVSPLVDAETQQRTVQAVLQLPNSYIVFAPICTIYDALTLLSLWQHLVIICCCLVIYGGWRVPRCREQRTGVVRRTCSETGRFACFLLALFAIYAGGLVISRPMARLVLRDPDLVAVDFHSHTNASWDGRRSFDAEANRRWHQAAGFGVAYISDHKNLAGARAAAATNPRRAGDGVILLQGLEARDEDEHIIALRVDTTRDIDARGEWHEPDYSHALAKELDASMLILSVPGNVRTLPGTGLDGRKSFYGVELSDGSPKGIAQEQRDREQILRLANGLNLALVAGSDNHGWGRTAIAWSVLRIPGWQHMTPREISAAIEGTLRANRRHAGRVIVRRSPDAGSSWLLLAMTPVTVPLTMLRTLSWPERASWAVWAWVLWGVLALPWLASKRERAVFTSRARIVDGRHSGPKMANASVKNV